MIGRSLAAFGETGPAAHRPCHAAGRHRTRQRFHLGDESLKLQARVQTPATAWPFSLHTARPIQAASAPLQGIVSKGKTMICRRPELRSLISQTNQSLAPILGLLSGDGPSMEPNGRSVRSETDFRSRKAQSPPAKRCKAIPFPLETWVDNRLQMQADWPLIRAAGTNINQVSKVYKLLLKFITS